MVKLEEVADEEFLREQQGSGAGGSVAGAVPFEDGEEGDWDTDDESDLSSQADGDDDHDDLDETLGDRLLALKDIVPPATRARIATTINTTSSYGAWGLRKAASAGWIVGASVLLLVAPFAIASIEDSQYAMQEREQEMRERGLSDLTSPVGSANGVAGPATAAVEALNQGQAQQSL